MLAERRYTVYEIDALRDACENKYIWGSYNGPQTLMGGSMSRSFNEAEKNVAVEEMVRTHMLAGHTAEDLMNADDTLARDQDDAG